jgi:hypothetical protein
MNLNVTSQIDTSTGAKVTGAYGMMDVNTDNLLSTGQVVGTLRFYQSADAYTKGMDTVKPVTLKQDGTIDSRVTGVVVQLTEQEVQAPNLPLTVFNKAAQSLEATYGWTVTVSQ